MALQLTQIIEETGTSVVNGAFRTAQGRIAVISNGVWFGNNSLGTESTSLAQESANQSSPMSFCANVSGTDTLIFIRQNAASMGTVDVEIITIDFVNGALTTIGLLEAGVDPSDTLASGSVCIDSNGDIHCAWIRQERNMGTSYDTLYYSNNISGSFKTPVEVRGQALEINVRTNDHRIAIDENNRPFISLKSGGTDDINQIAYSGTTDATSFTVTAPQIGGSRFGYASTGLAMTDNGQYFLAKYETTTDDLKLFGTDTINTGWSIELTLSDKSFDYIFGTKTQGNTIFVFFKDSVNNPNGISVVEIDCSVIGTPSFVQYLESTTENAQTSVNRIYPSTRYANYDINGTDQGLNKTSSEVSVRDTANFMFAILEDVTVTAGSLIKVSNWKEIAAGSKIAVGGAWKDITAIKIKEGGSWKDVTI